MAPTRFKITDPLKFYAEVVPKNKDYVEMDFLNEQFLDEFLEALQSSINQMSADGVRISLVASKARELGKYMAVTLDEEWKQIRGMEIQSVGIASISYDEESTKLIHMRNQGAMLGSDGKRRICPGCCCERNGSCGKQCKWLYGRIYGYGRRNEYRRRF